MGRLTAPIAAVAALALAGCGAVDPSLPPACTAGSRAIARALRAAPAAVTLRDGTRLSACIANAQTDAGLQSMGMIVTRVADRLADRARRDPAAAVRLGYLIGATRRGAAHTQGIGLELVHRLEGTARRAGTSPALLRGLRAGERTG